MVFLPQGLMSRAGPGRSVLLGLIWLLDLFACPYAGAFPGGLEVKASAWNEGDPGSIPGSGRSPGEGTATHSSVLAWRIPWTEEPAGYMALGSQDSDTTQQPKQH